MKKILILLLVFTLLPLNSVYAIGSSGGLLTENNRPSLTENADCSYDAPDLRHRLYVDSSNTSSFQNGSYRRPYSNLEQVFDHISNDFAGILGYVDPYPSRPEIELICLKGQFDEGLDLSYVKYENLAITSWYGTAWLQNFVFDRPQISMFSSSNLVELNLHQLNVAELDLFSLGYSLELANMSIDNDEERALYVEGTKYLTVSDVQVRGGILVESFLDAYLSDLSVNGWVRFEQGDQLVVEDSSFEEEYRLLHVSDVDRTEIYNSDFQDYVFALSIGDGAWGLSNSSEALVVEGSTFNGDGSGKQAVQVSDAQELRLVNNMVLNHTQAPDVSAIDFSDAGSIVLYHNSFYNNSFATTLSGYSVLYNNIFNSLEGQYAFNRPSIYTPGYDLDPLNAGYNLYYGDFVPEFDEYSDGYYYTFPAEEPHETSIIADPLFISSDDLHLQSNSPAIDAALPLWVSDDIDGHSRGSSPDIGADEAM